MEHDEGQALLAVAHGSRDPRHRKAVEALAETVRAQRPGLRVETAYLDHCGPTTARSLHALARDGYRAVRVVPLLLNKAFHVRQDIPTAVAEAHAALPQRLRSTVEAPPVGEALGSHRLIVSALEHRLRAAGVWPGAEDTGVVLGWAGSSDRVATAAVDLLAERWQRSGWERVVPVAAVGDAAGDAVRGLRASGIENVVVAQYFLAPGMLADRIRESAARAGADVITAELGGTPEVARTVLERFDAIHARACRLARVA